MKIQRKEEIPYLSQLEELIRLNREFDIIDLFSELHPADIADLIDNLEEQEKIHLFSLLEVEKASDVITELSDISREQILEDISDKKLAEIIDEMDSDDAADVIAELTEDQAKAVLEEIEPEESDDLKELLKYEEDTAGGIMQSELVSIHSGSTINDALGAVVQASDDIENVYNIFVVDRDETLIGAIPLQKLITSKRNSLATEAIDKTIPSVTADVDQEEVARMFEKYDLVSLPVVDKENHLLGRITIDDIVDVMEEESSEDIYRIAGLDEDDNIFNEPVESVKKRLPWLYLNLLTALASALVIGFFEDTIQMVIALAVFMPVVAGLGGNAGSQTLTLIVRGMALGEVTFENSKKALYKQIVVGIINGLAVGIVIGTVAYFWKGMPVLGLVLGLAMMINVFVGTLIGILIPLSLKWLKADPALGSHIFITAFTDAFGFFSFLGLATIFLKLMT
ncbi:MAG TPA: magnesium transporter [Syntrophales bacterium]|nr:magnesium transporter [Syntrophales bacterium]HPQ44055.1 magnesium transporter [Syntrophales bacterium]